MDRKQFLTSLPGLLAIKGIVKKVNEPAHAELFNNNTPLEFRKKNAQTWSFNVSNGLWEQIDFKRGFYQEYEWTPVDLED